MTNHQETTLTNLLQRPRAADHDDLTTSPHLPRLIERDGGMAPAAPRKLEECGLEPSILSDLAMKLAITVPHLTSDWAAERLHLPAGIVEKIFWQLKEDRFVEVLGESGQMAYRYTATQRGREFGQRLLEVSGYVGPAPVSLEAYTAMLDWQMAQRPQSSYEQILSTISPLVLPEQSKEVASLACSSGRSLFLFGPPGNGKTSLGRLLHNALQGELWIPYCLGIDGQTIRIFDKQCHEEAASPKLPVASEGSVGVSSGNWQLATGNFDPIDRRWVRIKPPMIVVGGEMTIEELDLIYSPAHRFYEAPPHLKANGGTFLIDDFGRQRVDPHDLLNRWIIPLEHQTDFMTLKTGQRLEVPFRLMLIVATNLELTSVVDPAFLRRMGYRLQLDRPTPENYARIFHAYAAEAGMEVPPGLISRLIHRYREEGRDLRCSEPRDLIERVRDVCRLRQVPDVLNWENLKVAWDGYFGQLDPPPAPEPPKT